TSRDMWNRSKSARCNGAPLPLDFEGNVDSNKNQHAVTGPLCAETSRDMWNRTKISML
ncbi:hypothetical protein CHS0354_005821, partial [Potamilus streckersoni]